MKLKTHHLVLAAFVGGCGLGVSFPFTGSFFPLAFVALVPLLVANFHIQQSATKRPILLQIVVGLIYFLPFNAIATWWVYNASPGGAYMAILANSLLMVLPFSLMGWISHQLGEKKGRYAFLIFWLCFEFLHYRWELSWPWLNLGHILGTAPKLIQWYAYSGVSGGTLWIIGVNLVVYAIVRNCLLKREPLRQQTPYLVLSAAVITVPVAVSLTMYYRYEESTDPVQITIVQPNIEAYREKFVLPVDFQIDKMLSAATKKMTPSTDLILFPETAIPYGIDEKTIDDHPTIQRLKNFVRQHHNTPLLTGADTYRFWDEKPSPTSWLHRSGRWYENYNTALMIQTRLPISIRHKSKLVLGSEKLPFIDWFPFLGKYAVELGGTSGALGTGKMTTNFTSKGVSYAPLICYESVYGDYVASHVRKGASVLSVMTNDGWYKNTPGHRQHRLFSQIRAIENRRSVARSANTGISCFIDQRGEVISELGWDNYGAIQTEINQNKHLTFYTRYGDIIGRVAAFLSIFLGLYSLTERLKKTKIGSKKKR